MANNNDPVGLLQDGSVVSKAWHAVAGLYFWEFITTLDYEWSIIRRHRPFRWTIWIYSTTRIFTVIAVIQMLMALDVTARYNCEVETVFELLFGYIATAFASFLIVLRIFAIWNKKKIIIAIAVGAWVVNVVFEIQSIVRLRSTWVAGAGCVVPNLHISELNILITLATDIILLLIMFFGLLHLGFHHRGTFGLGHLLWKQGVIWLLVATIAEVLPAVFLCLNSNDPLTYMFLPLSMVTLSIAATRIYRSLADYAFFGCTNHLSGSDSIEIEQSRCTERKANRVPITMSRMEVAINKTSDRDQTRRTSQNGSLTCIEGEVCEKPCGQHRLDESAETRNDSDVESQTQVKS